MRAREFYDNTANNYNSRHQNATALHMRKIEDTIIERYAYGKIIDVGCGTRNFGTGIDISLPMLLQAGGDRILGKAEYLPIKKGSADTALYLFTVLNMCDIERAVNQLELLLKKDGIAIISVSSLWDGKNTFILKRLISNQKSRRKKMRIEGYRISFHLFSKRELIELFAKNGMQLIYFSGTFKIQQPYWGWHKEFSLYEKMKLRLEKILPHATGSMYFAVFKKK